jgi:hypothetical protein
MKKILLVTLLLSVFTVSFGQKVKIKKKTIYVDGMEYMSYDKELDGSSIILTFYDLRGEEISYATGYEYFDPQQMDNASPEGRVYYFQISFEGSDEFCEISATLNNKKKIAKMFYKANILVDGKLNSENAKKFVKKKRKKHSARIKQIEESNNRGTTIIINN